MISVYQFLSQFYVFWCCSVPNLFSIFGEFALERWHQWSTGALTIKSCFRISISYISITCRFCANFGLDINSKAISHNLLVRLVQNGTKLISRYIWSNATNWRILYFWGRNISILWLSFSCVWIGLLLCVWSPHCVDPPGVGGWGSVAPRSHI